MAPVILPLLHMALFRLVMLLLLLAFRIIHYLNDYVRYLAGKNGQRIRAIKITLSGVEHRENLRVAIENVLQAKTADKWVELLADAGVPSPKG